MASRRGKTAVSRLQVSRLTMFIDQSLENFCAKVLIVVIVPPFTKDIIQASHIAIIGASHTRSFRLSLSSTRVPAVVGAWIGALQWRIIQEMS
jgi:hypothetical protein